MPEVVVIGAGIAGLANALFAGRAGADVLLIEADGAAAPDRPDDALTGWARPGVAQWGQGHNFHALGRRTLVEFAPDVLAGLLAAGAGERNFGAVIPPDDRLPTDDELVAVQCRRPVFEWVLRRAAAAEPRVRIESAARVAALLPAPAGRHGAGGVVLADGERLPAEWVIDASGRGSRLPQWLAGIGGHGVREARQHSGTLYYSRHFRLQPSAKFPDGDWLFGPTGDLGYLRFSLLIEDSRCFVITLNTPPHDTELKCLRDDDTWLAAAASIPALRPWVQPDFGRPISPVYSMGGLYNCLRDFRGVDSKLMAAVVPVGDALCHTNPTQGWGASIALWQAGRVAQALAGNAGSGASTARLLHELTDHVTRQYDAAAAEDRERARALNGNAGDWTDPANALFCRKIAYPVAAEDPRLFRAVQRRIHLLDSPDKLTADRLLITRALEMYEARRHASAGTPADGPSRDALLSTVIANRVLRRAAPASRRFVVSIESPLDLLHRYAKTPGSERPEVAKEISQRTQCQIDTTGRGFDLTEADLSNLDLREIDLRRATLNRAVLHGTDLAGANLGEVTMVCPGMERTNLTGASLRAAYVHALAIQTSKLDGADLSGLRDATGTLFHGCSMRGVDLSSANLAGGAFYQCDLSEAVLDRANLQGATLNECLLDGASAVGACVEQLTITKSSLRGTSMRSASGRGLILQRLTSADDLVLVDAHLPRLRLDNIRATGWTCAGLKAADADIADVSVTEASFIGADLTGTTWRTCSLPGIDLSWSTVTNGKFINCQLRGAKLAKAHAENLHIVESDLAAADLKGLAGRSLVARDVNLAGADLMNANLYRAMLTGDPPRGMNLQGANLENATLVQAYIAADLRRARLVGVNAAYSRFSQSDLSEANLDGAGMYESTWVKVTVTGASIAGLRAPVFVDRSPGLAEAVEARADTDGAAEFKRFLVAMATALSIGRTGST